MGDHQHSNNNGQHGVLFRSEDMSLIQMFVNLDSAHLVVSSLAELNCIEFKDLNPSLNAFSRHYIQELRRLDDISRRLRVITDLLNAHDVHPTALASNADVYGGRQANVAVDEIDDATRKYEQRLLGVQSVYVGLVRQMRKVEELKAVLEETKGFFEKAENRSDEIRLSFDDSDSAPLLEDSLERGNHPTNQASTSDPSSGYSPQFIAGIIDSPRLPFLERVLWRVLRGNLYMNYSQLPEAFSPLPEDPAASNNNNGGGNSNSGASAKPTFRTVFIIFAHGRDLLTKVSKIARSLGAEVYDIPSSPSERTLALREATRRGEDLETTLQNSLAAIRGDLGTVAEGLRSWEGVVKRERRVYENLNLWQIEPRGRTAVAEGWIPTRMFEQIRDRLQRESEASGLSSSPVLHVLPTTSTPPTYHKTNKLTEGFQGIIDAYGIATYQEVNPGIFAVVTFPFLFAVMFGDIGHGVILALFAAGMISVEKKYPRGFGSEIFDTFFFGRYIILLMGIFAVFTGFMYNDIFSLNLNMFTSGWTWPTHIPPEGPVTAHGNGGVYPFGLDPAWHGADNALLFTNSLKMKMSVIIGVIHMSFAICLQVPNFIHFGRRMDIWTLFLPQIIFMEAIFGYLIIIIVYKWTIDWSQTTAQPPNLLNTLIYMFLKPGTVDEPLYTGQAFLQSVLVLLALVCVPWMLLAKPYLLWKEHQKIQKQGYLGISDSNGGAQGGGGALVDDDEDEESGFGHAQNGGGEDGMNGGGGGGSGGGHGGGHGGHGDGEFEMGDIAIHQIIHTIEFCLGCISNTASYLRLWALSLAHAQLSEVLWTMTMKNGFSLSPGTFAGGVIVMAVFAFWFAATVAILVTMEGLSAFLHALRLHWVESNGKHYEGAGYAFQPVTFDDLVSDD